MNTQHHNFMFPPYPFPVYDNNHTWEAIFAKWLIMWPLIVTTQHKLKKIFSRSIRCESCHWHWESSPSWLSLSIAQRLNRKVISKKIWPRKSKRLWAANASPLVKWLLYVDFAAMDANQILLLIFAPEKTNYHLDFLRFPLFLYFLTKMQGWIFNFSVSMEFFIPKHKRYWLLFKVDVFLERMNHSLLPKVDSFKSR